MPDSPFQVSPSTIIEDFLKSLDKVGAEFQHPNGIKIAVGNDKPNAPRLIQYGSSVTPSCCEDGTAEGLNGSFTASFTDGSPSNPVQPPRPGKAYNDNGIRMR